jgi:hypothetical protein
MRALIALAISVLPIAAAHAADAEHPTVVELFQSQGCSSCPPANASLLRYSERSDILALTFAVDYWDRLGWKDTFSRHEYTERQYGYSSTIGSGVYTPQVVVNGRAAGVGDEVSEVESLAAKTDRGASGPSIAIEGGEVALGAGKAPAGGADVWVALYDPRVLNVPVARGENAGRTLAHRNVVKRFTKVGVWDGSATRLPLPGSDGLARAVLVQRRGVGPILAAARG